MKYQTKVYFSFLTVAVVSSALGLSIVYNDSKRRFTQGMRERIIAVSSTTAALLNPETIKEVIEGGTEKTPVFHSLVEELRAARNANRSESWYVLSLYLMSVSPTDKSQVIFVADAEENPASQVHLGQPDTEETYSHINQHLDEPYSPPYFITDSWGTWMSGFAPIYDAEGNYLATVGADVSASVIDEQLNVILLYGFWGLLGSIAIALIGAQILSKRISSSLKIVYSNMKEISEGNLDKTILLDTQDEFTELATSINEMAKALKDREKMKTSFARYVSKHVLDTIVKNDTTLKFEGERRKITILFTDIRQFTHLSEKLAPEKIVSLLNEYFETMIDTIFQYHGTLDKFLGDGMMVEFGAPLEDPNQELHAVQAAVEMQQRLKLLCEKWKTQGKPQVQMGIGIHTGYAVVGNIGSEKRMEYTAIGDTVNVASRLEQATKSLNSDILISQSTYEAVKDIFECKDIGPLTLPGRTEVIEVYSLSSSQPFESKEK